MDWIKIFHLLCVMGWMTGIFAVPRAIIFWRREFEEHGPGGSTAQLTIRLFRFSAGLGVLAIILGLWKGYDMGFPVWVHIKTGLVLLLVAHFVYTGFLVKAAHAGIFAKSDRFLRIYNETSVLIVVAILWVVVEQPL